MRTADAGRRGLVRGLVATVALSARPSATPAGGLEEIRKAASVLPGYGPPDLHYPARFLGRWHVARTVASVATPLGDDKAPEAALRVAQALLDAPEPLTYDVRFIDGGDGLVIADRAFNAEQRAGAPPGTPRGAFDARWDASNPNVLTLADTRTGSLVETKVTKRSQESPSDEAFGTSEYARIADAGSHGVLGAVPVILALRVQTRYRLGPDANTVEGLELVQTFDPTATGFADLAGASPVLTVKSRLRLTRGPTRPQT